MKNTRSDDMYTKSRNCILQSAKERLLHYGYTKTTMSEIAGDISMSTANLYRFFTSKEEIFLACIDLTVDERFTKLQAIVSSTNGTPQKKLEQYALALITESYKLSKENHVLGELLDLIAKNHPEKLRQKNEKHYLLIEKIIIDGIANKDLVSVPSRATAIAIYTAFSSFEDSLVSNLYSRPEMEAQARGIIQLILTGIT
jgi:AcrR family transcriptional regulator